MALFMEVKDDKSWSEWLRRSALSIFLSRTNVQEELDNKKDFSLSIYPKDIYLMCVCVSRRAG